MKKELQEKLFNEFPNIFFDRNKSIMETCMCWGIDCGDGWYNLIRDLCLKIKKLDKKRIIKAVQVKEKFGELRFYTNYYIDKIDKEINKAEQKSLKICEKCGKFGKLRGKGWLVTLCDRCWEKRNNNLL